MLPDRVSNPGPLTYESGALPIALRGPARASEWLLYLVKHSGIRKLDTQLYGKLFVHLV